MGRNKGSRTGVVITYPVECQNHECGTVFRVVGKYAPHGAKPQRYCSAACYQASRRGKQPPQFVGKGGAPKGREPWNKGKSCPQLSGSRNGMFGKTHSPEVRAKLAELARLQMSELTRRLSDGRTVLLPRSDPEYGKVYMRGWRKARREAIERDGHACTACAATDVPLQVHHVEPFCFNLRHDLENLTTLCRSCHQHVHQGEITLSHVDLR